MEKQKGSAPQKIISYIISFFLILFILATSLIIIVSNMLSVESVQKAMDDSGYTKYLASQINKSIVNLASTYGITYNTILANVVTEQMIQDQTSDMLKATSEGKEYKFDNLEIEKKVKSTLEDHFNDIYAGRTDPDIQKIIDDFAARCANMYKDNSDLATVSKLQTQVARGAKFLPYAAVSIGVIGLLLIVALFLINRRTKASLKYLSFSLIASTLVLLIFGFCVDKSVIINKASVLSQETYQFADSYLSQIVSGLHMATIIVAVISVLVVALHFILARARR